MAQIVSKIDTRTAEFAENRAAMQPLVEDLKATLQRNAAGGSQAAASTLQAGKLLARSDLLLIDSPFLELSPLAAQGVYGESCLATHHGDRAFPGGSAWWWRMTPR